MSARRGRSKSRKPKQGKSRKNTYQELFIKNKTKDAIVVDKIDSLEFSEKRHVISNPNSSFVSSMALKQVPSSTLKFKFGKPQFVYKKLIESNLSLRKRFMPYRAIRRDSNEGLVRLNFMGPQSILFNIQESLQVDESYHAKSSWNDAIYSSGKRESRQSIQGNFRQVKNS